MTDLIKEIDNKICLLTLNRTKRHNAFDDKLISQLQIQLDDAIEDPSIRVIVLKANGSHFSAGADLEWMQKMATYTAEENMEDALELANVMYTLHSSKKPCIAMVHGAAFGGGAGLAAACDIAISTSDARFCFSEVKLGLIPAVISPYVVEAVGSRMAKALFMSAEVFNGKQAKDMGLVQYCVAPDELLSFTLNFARKLTNLAPNAVSEAKELVDMVSYKTINSELIHRTARLIAEKRVSEEGQKGLHAFLNKIPPEWD